MVALPQQHMDLHRLTAMVPMAELPHREDGPRTSRTADGTRPDKYEGKDIYGRGVIELPVSIGQKSVTLSTEVPEEWGHQFLAGTLTAGTLSLVSGTRDFHARLRCDPDMKVRMRVMRSDSQTTVNEAAVVERLPAAGHVLAHFDMQTVINGDSVYFLTEDTKVSLKTLLDDWSKKERPMPLTVSLPILIDVLRAVIELNSAGIVHGALTARNVHFDKAGRAVITGLDHAFPVEKECSDDFGCGRRNGAPAAKRAPEMLGSIMTGPSNNVWAVGLLFADMCLAMDPVRMAINDRDPSIDVEDQAVLNREEVDSRIMGIIRESFSIRQSIEHIRWLEDDAKELLEGLLVKDLEKRWSAQGALEQAINVAVASGISVAPPRQRPSLPECWNPGILA